MPGSNDRALTKARTLPADCIIIDFEDAVSPEDKQLARDTAVSHLRQGGFGKREPLYGSMIRQMQLGRRILPQLPRLVVMSYRMRYYYQK